MDLMEVMNELRAEQVCEQNAEWIAFMDEYAELLATDLDDLVLEVS